MIAIEASILIAHFRSDSGAEEERARLRSYLEVAEKGKTQVIVPAPAFSEFMAKVVDREGAYSALLRMSKRMRIAEFGQRAAIECAEYLRSKPPADKRHQGQTWAKAKFDWQIVAVAKVEGCREILSHDGDIERLAKRHGLVCKKISDLPLPDSYRQHVLPLVHPQSEVGAPPAA